MPPFCLSVTSQEEVPSAYVWAATDAREIFSKFAAWFYEKRYTSDKFTAVSVSQAFSVIQT